MTQNLHHKTGARRSCIRNSLFKRPNISRDETKEHCHNTHDATDAVVVVVKLDIKEKQENRIRTEKPSSASEFPQEYYSQASPSALHPFLEH
jgi:hypothetical protein